LTFGSSNTASTIRSVPFKRRIIGGGGDAGQHLGLLFRRHLAALHALVEEGFGMGLAAIADVLGGVDQDDFDPGIGGDIGDARPHHARTDDAQFRTV
jgi:hypothetical protein